MNPSAKCAALTESFEDCELTAYHGPDDPPGLWTIGWGQTNGITEGMVWTQEQADVDLIHTLNQCGLIVSRLVDVALTQNQFDALTDFEYNEGSGALAGSTLLKRLNAGDFAGAAAQFLVWDKVSENGQLEPSAGLLRRRVAEQTLFNS